MLLHVLPYGAKQPLFVPHQIFQFFIQLHDRLAVAGSEGGQLGIRELGKLLQDTLNLCLEVIVFSTFHSIEMNPRITIDA
jgi:hypothetical protein